MKSHSTLKSATRIFLTLATLAIAGLFATALWRHYMISPWTRDGRVRVETVALAPEVAGVVRELRVVDNQFVRKGDVLFVVDPESYQLAMEQAKAALDGEVQTLGVAKAKSQRRAKLTDLSVSNEEKEQYDGAAGVAAAAVEQAKAQLGIARLNLKRTVIRSPVNGYVSNLRLRVGDFLAAGQPTMTLADSDSFWVAGYFEETQLSAVHDGDPARFILMGYPGREFHGRVDSISHGIVDQNGDNSGASLASVNPVFTWVRLSQRIPVRIAIDPLPEGVTLAAGMTCTISIGSQTGLLADLKYALHYWTTGWRY
jgi:multidrug resistance efflux pump